MLSSRGCNHVVKLEMGDLQHGELTALTKVLHLCYHHSICGEGQGAHLAVPHQCHMMPLAVVHRDVSAERHKLLLVLKELYGNACIGGLQQHLLVAWDVRGPGRTGRN